MTMDPDGQPGGETLFSLLDKLVQANKGPLSIRGRIALGVRSSAGETWWVASFDKVVSVSRQEKRPPCDSWLLLGGRDAEELALTGRLPRQPELLLADGDRELAARFVREIIQPNTILDVRTKLAQR